MNNIGAWLTHHVRLRPEKTALVYKDRRISYRQLNERVNRLARALEGLGVRKSDRVAGVLLNGNEILEIMFACAKLGAIFVPMNFRLSRDEMIYILTDAAARHVFYHGAFRETLAEVRRQYRDALHWICVDGGEAGDPVYEALLQSASPDEVDRHVTWEDVHLMMYTSGTTGRPKGAMLSQANTQWNAFNVLHSMPITDEEITLTVAPLFHIGAMNIFTTPVLYRGGTVVIHEQFDPVRILQMIEAEKVTSLFMVPSMWLALMQVPNFNDYDLSSLKIGISGGAPCPIPVIEYFQKAGIPFYEGFGLTETAPVVCVLDEHSIRRKHGSVGKPPVHTQVRIVDELDRDLPPGQVGELLVKGPNVMVGYWNKPLETEEAMRGGWFHTGDLAKMDEEGFIYIVDRKKDMIISGGENIYPVEVEQVLFRHPKIREVAVIGIPDEKWGEVVKAVVALKEGETITLEEIRAFCEGKLARFKMPRALEIVDALPRNATGKVLKTVLRQAHSSS